MKYSYNTWAAQVCTSRKKPGKTKIDIGEPQDRECFYGKYMKINLYTVNSLVSDHPWSLTGSDHPWSLTGGGRLREVVAMRELTIILFVYNAGDHTVLLQPSISPARSAD